MRDDPAPRPAAGTAPVLLALALLALALRPQIAAIGPLVPGIRDELGASHGFVGLLTAIPVLCMGLFAPFGPPLARMAGLRGGVALAVAVVIGFGAARAFLSGEVLLLVATFGIGIGTALVGPILPMFVRSRLPDHLVGGTSAYAAGTTIGAALAAAVAVPLVAVTGGWRGALLVISAVSVGAVVAWLALSRRPPAERPRVAATPPGTRGMVLPHLPWRRPIAWAIGLLFGLQSWLYYGVTAWLVSVYVERGWAAVDASVLLSVVNVATLAATLVVPMASRRGSSRRSLLVTAASMATVGLLGVAAGTGPAAAWAILLGAGLGMSFTLVLTLPADIGRDGRDVGGAAALMLLVGYLLASAAPFVLGTARDLTGDFAASVWLLVLIAALMVPLAWTLAPQRLRPARVPVHLP